MLHFFQYGNLVQKCSLVFLCKLFPIDAFNGVCLISIGSVISHSNGRKGSSSQLKQSNKFWETGPYKWMDKSTDTRRVKEEEYRMWDETQMQKIVFVTLNWVRHAFKHSGLFWKQSTQSGMVSCNTKVFDRMRFIFTSRTMPHHLTLTTPFNRYNSSKRLPLLELGTGVSSTFNELSIVFIFFEFCRVGFNLKNCVAMEWWKEVPAAVAVVELWPENDVYTSVE